MLLFDAFSEKDSHLNVAEYWRIEKMNEILTNFATFPRKKMIVMTIDEKIKHSAATVCYLCGEKFSPEDKNFKKIKDHCHYTGNIKAQLI